jgi:cell wall-associated NlpC family hydrolase
MTPLPQALQDQIVQAARGLVGTPFAHQGRVPGCGLDCVGALIAVGQECGLRVTDDTTYPRETDGSALHRCLRYACEPIDADDLDRGDILIFQRGQTQWHAAIVSKLSPLSMIHAWHRFTGGCVREEIVSDEWVRRIFGAWRYNPEAG